MKIIKSCEFNADQIIQKTTASALIKNTVAEIISNVIEHGDSALRMYTEKFDGCKLNSFEVKREEIDKAADTVDPVFIDIMQRAAKNIEYFHRYQIRQGFELPLEDGIIMGQKVTPIERAGVYVPGGRNAPLPSSLLMSCIPAKLAGVKEIIVVSPPSGDNCGNAQDSIIDARILAAAKIAGVDRIFAIGGAQAIAALAHGTESIPRVDIITGPGSVYMIEAKRQVFGTVGIEMLPGPSDILIIADSGADPIYIAADMLSQAEHGPDSPAVLVTTCPQLADKVIAEINMQITKLARKDMAQASIDEHGLIVIVKSIDEAFDISNKLAPEHLEIHLDEPYNYIDKVINAGSVFLGKYTPEPLGDYFAGVNHTLPTSGTARFSSPLSVDAFTKTTSYTYYSREALFKAGNDVIRFANE
jgi:histidinol dehydrogenase